MLVLYDYDSNYINYDPMTTIHVNSILTIYQKSITILIKSGLKPILVPAPDENIISLFTC